mgnify:CR=1 FL=1
MYKRQGKAITDAAREAVAAATAGGGWDNEPVRAAAPHAAAINEFITPKNILTLSTNEVDMVYVIPASIIDYRKLMKQVSVAQLVEFLLYVKEVHALVANARSVRTGRLRVGRLCKREHARRAGRPVAGPRLERERHRGHAARDGEQQLPIAVVEAVEGVRGHGVGLGRRVQRWASDGRAATTIFVSNREAKRTIEKRTKTNNPLENKGDNRKTMEHQGNIIDKTAKNMPTT